MFFRSKTDAAWLGAGFVPGAADWQNINTKVFHAINGVRGGTWAPKAPISFPSGGFQVTGPTVVAHGGELVVGKLEIEGDAWPKFAPGHALTKRRLVQGMERWEVTPRTHWVIDASGSIQSIALGFLLTGQSQLTKPNRGRLPLEVHDCATLASVVFNFRVPAKRNAAPYAMPRFRVVQVDTTGHAKPLASTATGADADGWQSPAQVTNAAAWYANGQAQAFTYACDQNHTIDVSQFSYYAEIIEEDVQQSTTLSPHGPNLDGAAVRWPDIQLATTGPIPALSGVTSVDGQSTKTGDRILVKNGIAGDETASYANGIWLADDSGDWVRDDYATAGDPSAQRAFAYVRGGASNGGWAWMQVPPFPVSIWAGPSTPLPANRSAYGLHFERYIGVGNKYHSVVLNFEGIEELRWQ